MEEREFHWAHIASLISDEEDKQRGVSGAIPLYFYLWHANKSIMPSLIKIGWIVLHNNYDSTDLELDIESEPKSFMMFRIDFVLESGSRIRTKHPLSVVVLHFMGILAFIITISYHMPVCVCILTFTFG